eukprot:g10427.t1
MTGGARTDTYIGGGMRDKIRFMDGTKLVDIYPNTNITFYTKRELRCITAPVLSISFWKLEHRIDISTMSPTDIADEFRNTNHQSSLNQRARMP